MARSLLYMRDTQPEMTDKVMMIAKQKARRNAGKRGFTLTELLVVIAMIGILSALAIASYRRLTSSAGTSEAVAMLQSIRAAEESYKAETLSYLGCSGCGGTGCAPGAGDLTKYYPQTTSIPSDRKWNFENPNHPDFACWNMLHAQADGPVQFGYAVVMGTPADAPPATALAIQPNWPAPQDLWYVVQAAADRDGDSKFAVVVGSNFTFSNGLAVENDDE